MDKPGQVKKEKEAPSLLLVSTLSGSACACLVHPVAAWYCFPSLLLPTHVQYGGGTERFERQGDRFRAAVGVGKLVRGAEPSNIEHQTTSGKPEPRRSPSRPPSFWAALL
jgi:hypothetical protein